MADAINFEMKDEAAQSGASL